MNIGNNWVFSGFGWGLCEGCYEIYYENLVSRDSEIPPTRVVGGRVWIV